MKKILIAGAAALLCASSANADTVVHFTGSTAFRASAVAAIEALMGGAGNFKAAYQSSGTITSTSAANNVVFQGTIAGLPAGANPVTIKCSWGGSTGGIRTVVQNLDLTTWMSISNLPAGNSTVGVPSPSFTLDTTQFPGETPKADVTMEDSAQASTGFTDITLTETQVGVLSFEWVAGNGSPANLDNITPLLAQAVLSGGAPLSQFTGVSTDTKAIYAVGRNFDSGTRLSCLAETGIGVFGGVQHIQVDTAGGAAGTAGSSIATIKLWPAETILGQPFTIGNSGYSSGGTLADVLATPGSAAANTTTGVPAAQQVLFGNGHLIGYLGRSDASRACRTSVIAGNTAHRMKWNGFQIWNGAIGSNGAPAGYNDNLITEGLYQLWEYQNLAYRSTYSGNGKLVADAVANRIIAVDATLSGTKLSDMNVSKAVEGGLITHN